MSLFKQMNRRKCQVQAEIRNLWNRLNHKKKLLGSKIRIQQTTVMTSNK